MLDEIPLESRILYNHDAGFPHTDFALAGAASAFAAAAAADGRKVQLDALIPDTTHYLYCSSHSESHAATLHFYILRESAKSGSAQISLANHPYYSKQVNFNLTLHSLFAKREHTGVRGGRGGFLVYYTLNHCTLIRNGPFSCFLPDHSRRCRWVRSPLSGPQNSLSASQL